MLIVIGRGSNKLGKTVLRSGNPTTNISRGWSSTSRGFDTVGAKMGMLSLKKYISITELSDDHHENGTDMEWSLFRKKVSSDHYFFLDRLDVKYVVGN